MSLYERFRLTDERQSLITSSQMCERWPHPSVTHLLSHPIVLPQAKLDKWAHSACELAQLLSHQSAFSAGLPELDKTLKSSAPDCFSVDFAITQENDELAIKLIEAQGFSSVMGLMLDFESLFSPDSMLMGKHQLERQAVLLDKVTHGLPPEKVALLDDQIFKQPTICDFMSSMKFASPHSISEIYNFDDQWMHFHGTQAHEIKRVYHRSIYHTLADEQKQQLLCLLESNKTSHFNHPAWYYKIDKASLGRIEHETLPNTFDIKQADELDLSKMVLKYPSGFAGKEVFLSPSKEQVNQAPENSVLQELIQYNAFHPALNSEKKLCVELRFMLLHTEHGFVPVTTLARATYDGNLMRHRENKMQGEGYTVAIGVNNA